MMFRRAALVVVLCCAGCLPLPRPATPDQPPPPKPVAPVVTRADVCAQLAAHITAGHLETTDDLVRVLRLLKDTDRWTNADSVALDAAWPDLATARRPLTADDAARLKGVK